MNRHKRVVLTSRRRLFKAQWRDRKQRFKEWWPGLVCVWRGHDWQGQFCAKCGEFYP